MMKAIYYLYFALWRACRASKDPALGEFRVGALLIMIEASFAFGLLSLFAGGRLGEMSLVAVVAIIVLPLLVLNWYLFGDVKKRRPYEREFATYARLRRIGLDVATLVAVFGAMALPVVVHLLR